ncbi:MAG: S8 family serine peptidase [Anaerolineae bacterium]|nr:S8 family serine peptidase [Anaerolineae bacterium]
MARKHILGLFLLGLFLLIVFAVVAVVMRPAPQQVAAIPTLMSLPTITETQPPTDSPTQLPTTISPTEGPIEETATVVSAEIIAPTERSAPVIPTHTATATTALAATEIPPTASAATTVPPVVIVSTSAPVAVQPPPPAPNVVVISFAPESSTAERAAYIEAIGGQIETSIEALDTVVVSLPEAATAQALEAAPIVQQAEPDYFATVLEAPDDPLYPEQWGLQAIGAESVWARLPEGAQRVTIAVIDTGICADHPELAGRILAGYDFVDDDAVPQDDFGHGCAVAGVIAAQMGNGQGIAGLAPNAQILPVRVLNSSGYGSYSDIAEGIIYAADQGAQVINLSLGGMNPSTVLENAVGYAMSRGVQVVAAAGNNFGGQIMYPAAYAPVISVGALDQHLQHSSFNPAGALDVYAPGQGISALALNGGYTALSGTSLAAPHVSAAIALSMALGEPFVANGQNLSLGESGAAPTIPPTATAEPTLESVVLPEDNFNNITIDRDAVDRPTYPVSSDLYQLAQLYQQSTVQALTFAETSLLQLNGSRVLVDIAAENEAVVPAVIAALPGIGAEVLAHAENFITAYVPIDQLEAATNLPGVQFIQSALPPMPLDGELSPRAQFDGSAQALTQGVAASNANIWQSAGFNGNGVKVGVIDAGFLNYTNAIASGDLPTIASGRLVIYQPPGMSFFLDTDHGTAVAEIVYDMAPMATIYLGTPNSPTSMANYIVDMACNLGIKVIQSSIGFYVEEDGDGTGLVTNAIAQAEDCGALYVQAAGNNANYHWDMAATLASFGGDSQLDFTPGDEVLHFGNGSGSCYTLSAGTSINVYLRWDAWPTTNQDYDLFLIRWTGSEWVNVVQSSRDQSVGGVSPTEWINTLTPTAGCYGLYIDKWSATGNHTFDLMGHNMPNFEYIVQSRSLVDPATSIDSFGVAAVDVINYSREYYSSIGPAHAAGGTINDGAANQQPRIAGYANVNTSVNSSFNGTSAAAPHVSGAAALVMERFPSYGAPQIRALLESRALDMGTGGYDTQYGMGRLWLGLPTLTPIPTGSTTQNDTGFVEYNGAWTLQNNGLYNGGTTHTTGTPGASANFRVSIAVGGGITVGRTLGPDRGNMLVCVGSAPCLTFSNYSPTYLFQQPLTILSQVSGNTLVTISHVGNAGQYIDVDFVSATGVYQPLSAGGTVQFQDSSAAIAYNGLWTTLSSGAYNGGTMRYSSQPGMSYTFMVTANAGERLRILRTLAPDRGSMRVCFSEIYGCQVINNYSPGVAYQQEAVVMLPWTATYPVTVTFIGSQGQYLDIDAIEFIVPQAPLTLGNTFQENSPNLNFAGSWGTHNSVNYNGGSMRFSGLPGSNISFRVSGNAGQRLEFIRTMAPDRGNMRVCVESECADYSNFSFATRHQQSLSILLNHTGNFQITITHQGQAGQYLDLDAVRLVNGPTALTVGATYQNDSPNLIFNGLWAPHANAVYDGGTIFFTSEPKASVTFMVNATAGQYLVLERVVAPDRANFTVCFSYLYGCQTINNISSTVQYQKPISILLPWTALYPVTITFQGTGSQFGDIDLIAISNVLVQDLLLPATATATITETATLTYTPSASPTGTYTSTETITPETTVEIPSATATSISTVTTTETETPQPTDTPLPTLTPVPPTETPQPTDTPLPTLTPVLPTETPQPTDTPLPTLTPVPPTETPQPTLPPTAVIVPTLPPPEVPVAGAA